MNRRAVGCCALVALLALQAACTSTTQGPTDAASPMPSVQSPEPSVAPTEEASTQPTSSPTADETGVAVFEADWSTPFTMTIPGDWRRDDEASNQSTLYIRGGAGRFIAFTKSGPETVDAWLEHITSTAAVEAGQPAPVEVGGASGFVIDIRVTEQAGQPPFCAQRCWPVFSDTGSTTGWVAVEGSPSRFWIVDVNGETVAIATDAREAAFASWVEMVEEALATLQWGS